MIAGMVNGQINAFETWPGGPETTSASTAA